MKHFIVNLSYWSNRNQTKITVAANSPEEAREIALKANPNARIEGPGSIWEKSITGNTNKCLFQ